ncbi:MAG TPA: hypothetical protein VLK82_25260 [Candidatus Tectomicrobia bacterium]|nr:hypothetical protein [Candidatus Tectomicrobia bacterium]
MTPQRLQVQCPSCGSGDITYTCEPRCCFNHICGVCYTTFELFTEALGRVPTELAKPLQARDSLAPTVACARCGSLEVYRLEPADNSPSELACVECYTLLRLGFAAVESR